MPVLDNSLLVAIFLAIIGQSTILWLKLGNVQTGLIDVRKEQTKVAIALGETNKKSCPFPACPVMRRAIEEAAPPRDISEENKGE